ncbi:MAG TPA: agmatinase [Syntrophomonadaceae bacterium]|nr:agmatinase [Syntrophomonadaceae bacterium]
MKYHDLLDRRVTFLESSEDLDGSDRVILGLPMDATTSFRPGTRLAPFRVREVSEGLEDYSVYQDKSLQDINFYDAGSVIIPFGNVTESLTRMERVAEGFLSMGKKIFSIGGEHLVSLPMIKAYYQKYPNLAVIQLDAHADLRMDYLGEQLSHASVMRRVVEIIGPGSLFQLGIRSGLKEEIEYAADYTSLYLDEVITKVPVTKDKIGARPVYITVDIDVLDPAYAPGTGTPEPGGITTRELFNTLMEFRDIDVVGFDVVEISPPYEPGDNTAIVGAKLIREALLAY